MQRLLFSVTVVSIWNAVIQATPSATPPRLGLVLAVSASASLAGRQTTRFYKPCELKYKVLEHVPVKDQDQNRIVGVKLWRSIPI